MPKGKVPKAETVIDDHPVIRFRPRVQEIEGIEWKGSSKCLTALLTFTHDDNGYRRIIVFTPMDTGVDMSLRVWSAKRNEYVPVPVGYYVCKDADGCYSRLSPAELSERYTVVASAG